MDNLVNAVVDGDQYIDMPFAERGADLLERSGLSGRVFYDESSKQFWMQDASGEWRGRDQRTFSTYLKFLGYCPVVRTKEQEKISEVDHVMAHISLNCSVQYAGPIAGYKRGLITNNGQRVLVTREAQPVKPKKGEFPVIWELLHRMFGMGPEEGPENPGENQLPYLLGWWKHSLECLNNKYEDHRGLCMVFAGEAGSGKTLVKDLISYSMGGRECKPYRYMIGLENFNGEFIGSELWVVDDEQCLTDHRSRSEFGANIKKTVADLNYRIRGMMREGVVLSMFRRLLICVNREPERLMVLPQLDDDIADKITILLAHKHPMPMPVGTPEEKAKFWHTLKSEIPAFVYFLLNEYEIDKEDYGRFGIRHFHHPALCADLFSVSREREFFIQVNRALEKMIFSDDIVNSWYWCGSAEELYTLLSSEDSPLTRKEKNNLPWSNTMGKMLTKIAKQMPERCVAKKIGGLKKWFISREGRQVMDAVLIERGKRKKG